MGWYLGISHPIIQNPSLRIFPLQGLVDRETPTNDVHIFVNFVTGLLILLLFSNTNS